MLSSVMFVRASRLRLALGPPARPPDGQYARLEPWLPRGVAGWLFALLYTHPTLRFWMPGEVQWWWEGAFQYAFTTQTGIARGLSRWSVDGPRHVPWTT